MFDHKRPHSHSAFLLLTLLCCQVAGSALPILAGESLPKDSASPAIPSYSIYFNGQHQGSIIRVPFHLSQNSYVATRGLTFEAWIKPMRGAPGGSILNKAVGMCKDDWILNQTSASGIEFKLANSCTGNNRFLEESNILLMGQWQHVAGVWDGDSIRLFHNGQQLLRARCDGVPSANAIDMSIGANNHWDGDHVSFMGAIDEVRFSNTPRYLADFSPARRLETDEHTVFLFHFDEGSGDTLHDASQLGLLAYGESIAWAPDVADSLLSVHEASHESPAGLEQTVVPGNAFWLWALVILVGGLSSAAFVWFVRRPRTGAVIGPAPEPAASIPTEGVAIDLFGGFHIRGSKGEDLTERLTGRNRELFLIILLHTVRENGNGAGIQTAKLTAALWPDLDLQTAKNARGVAIKRLRETLGGIGDIQVVQNDSVWRIVPGSGVHCDLFELVEEFGPSARTKRIETEAEIERFLDLTGKGRFLSDVDHEWLDPIRTDIENRVITDIGTLLDMKSPVLPGSLLIRIADAGLAQEPVNERFLIVKLRALASLGRMTAARATFARFSEEYQAIVGSRFPRQFQDCIGAGPDVTKT